MYFSLMDYSKHQMNINNVYKTDLNKTKFCLTFVGDGTGQKWQRNGSFISAI